MTEENNVQDTQEPISKDVTSAFAELISGASNPLNGNKANEITLQTALKTEEKPDSDKDKVDAEAAKTEVKAEAKEEKTSESTKTEEIAKEVSKTPQEPEEQENPESEFVNLINSVVSESGVQFNSLEDLKTVIAENKKFKEAANELSGLTQEERARIEVGREYGDFGLYDRVMGIDTAKLSHKDALKNVYFLDNIGKNQNYLEKAFEKTYLKIYEEDPDEEFSKLQLENDGQEAIQKIIELQKGLKERGKVSGAADESKAIEDKKKEDEKWFAAVDEILSKNDRVTYTLEDGLSFNIVMDDKDKKVIQEFMDKPVAFLKEMITDKDGKWDHKALFEFIMRNKYFDKVIAEARTSGAAHKEEKILKDKKNTVIESGKAGAPESGLDLGDQLAKSVRSLISH
jgi:hypothetical protein